ncbi:DNA translocase [Williamsoniiplasma somnilux]|uniref:DNA translocase n=2 Tax=Williamsoniiplasma somnilux TaxID=215578 RepID=A0A2K8P1V3_9MOLU|nr:DNA translocase FtsK [Williamsoniiplasma somnilux]ATZ18883.1 DNA translocase [Williamsoniiplasma somnilux]
MIKESKNSKNLNSENKIEGKVYANYDFNEERTIAFETKKKKYKQDSIAWMIWGLVLFFFTIFSAGRITVVGQFFDDSIFNLIFGWFKFPIYLLLFFVDICIYSGIRFKFKKRFLGMIVLTSLLLMWIISLSLMLNIYVNKIVVDNITFDKLWSNSAFSDTFNIYWKNWLQNSIYGSNYGIDKMDFLMSSKGYFNLYAGGGAFGSILTGLSLYLSIPGAYVFWTLIAFFNTSWIFTGSMFFFLKPKAKRKGKALRILSLKNRNNPNLKNQENIKIETKDSMWKSLNVFGKESEDAIAQSDLTIKMPSYNRHQVEELKDSNDSLKFLEDALNVPHKLNLDDDIFLKENINSLENLEQNNNFFKSRRQRDQLKTNEISATNELFNKKNDVFEILNDQPQNGNFGDIDPNLARKLFEQEQNVTPFGPNKKIDKEIDSNFEDFMATSEIAVAETIEDQDILSDTNFFEELFEDDKILSSEKKEINQKTLNIIVEQPEINENLSFDTKPVISKPIININYLLPKLNILTKIPKDWEKERLNKENANLKALAIDEVFNQFKIKAKVINTIIGPTVTKFEIQPEPGTKVNSITALENDLKLALASQNIRLEAPIQGKNLVGIEIANGNAEIVSMREIIESIPEEQNEAKLLFVLGKNVLGEPLTAELNKMPHLLVAGSTGSGKSVMINALIVSILLRAKPHEVKFLMIDPKKVELSIYSNLPHMLCPVISDMREASQALKMIVAEMERRYELFAKQGSRNIEGYNKKNEEKDRLPFFVVIIDELADLMMTGDRKSVEESIMRITQMARAAGIHLVVATQRPSVDVITGTIKTNIPTRIAFAVTTGTDSRTILDSIGAEKLIGRGDMLFMPPGSSELIRAQGAYLSDEEIENIVDYVKNQDIVNYDPTFININKKNSNIVFENSNIGDELYEQVKQYVIIHQKASTSFLQRKFGLGHNRAANLIDLLEANGIIGPFNGAKPREVLIKPNNEWEAS